MEVNIKLTIISIIILLYLSVTGRIRSVRFRHKLELNRIYDHMELYFVKNGIHLNTDTVKLLKIYKNLVVNSQLLDLRFLVITNELAKNKANAKRYQNLNTWFNKTMESMDPEFKTIAQEFDAHSEALVTLSLWKPQFVYVLVRRILPHVIHTALKTKFRNTADRLRADYKNMLAKNETLHHYGMRLAA